VVEPKKVEKSKWTMSTFMEKLKGMMTFAKIDMDLRSLSIVKVAKASTQHLAQPYQLTSINHMQLGG